MPKAELMQKIKIGIVLLLLGMLSCGDGDLTIDSISFDDEAIATCDTPTTETTVFFKLKEKQALILVIPTGLLKNEISSGGIETSIGNSSTTLTYRLFNDKVSNTYFCSMVPPNTPIVEEDVVAESGKLIITTTLGTEENTYMHKMELKDISFIRDNGDRITNLETSDFGTIITQTN